MSGGGTDTRGKTEFGPAVDEAASQSGDSTKWLFRRSDIFTAYANSLSRRAAKLHRCFALVRPTAIANSCRNLCTDADSEPEFIVGVASPPGDIIYVRATSIEMLVRLAKRGFGSSQITIAMKQEVQDPQYHRRR